MKKFIIILITSTLLLAQTPIHNVKFIGNWDASQMPGILGGVNGGTGVANTGLTLTLGGNLVTSGASSLTLTTTGATNITLPTSGTIVSSSNNLSVFASTTSAQLATVIGDETGSGALVFANSPTLVTPNIGVATATSINGTSIPSSGTLATTTNKLNAFASTTSAELAGVISNETGTGNLVFATSPTLVTPVLGVATATSINGTSIPANATLPSVLTGTSVSIGGGLLTAGTCATGTATVTGATTSMTSTLPQPTTYPGDGFEIYAYVSTADTVTIKVCALVALTPTASTYLVKVIN